MKVSTVACVFGALIAREVTGKNILDIGGGTGLLPLMIAQKNKNATIDSIEIDKDAYEQMAENFSLSPWKDRLKAYHGDFLNYNFSRKYELIISNPPFFQHHLQTKNTAVNLARHRDHLLNKISEIASGKAHVWLLLPEFEMKLTEGLFNQNGYYVNKCIAIKNFTNGNVLVKANCFTKEEKEIYEEKLVIRKDRDTYTSRFLQLLKDYYLHL